MATDAHDAPGFPLFALIACVSIIIGDIADFRLKDTMEAVLSDSRASSATFLLLFVFFCVIAGGKDETAQGLARNVRHSVYIFLLLCGLNFVDASMLPFVMLTLAADYGMWCLRNSARREGDLCSARLWTNIARANAVAVMLIIGRGVVDTYVREGVVGVMQTMFPVKKAGTGSRWS